ncbi:hypothetical protein CALCODRAFT_555505 [Calocera cornea HHB12733]|uniref:MARVEL domain-containing protein n=1 Tax=Calocera cornea HHB12733 TaxID=1353952 RepID=A0A165FSX0_9BASI|nr:hypothetical protein CALCODRAFT_555505 [Calocera cornea HHB12733]
MVKVPVPPFKTARFFGFLLLFIFSVIVLPIASTITQSNLSGAPDYAVAVAVSALTVVLTVLVLGLEAYRPPTCLSWTLVELIWTFLLLGLWAATGGMAAHSLKWTCRGNCFRGNYQGRGSCSNYAFMICREIKVLLSFSWINFLILLILFIWALSVAIKAARRGDTFIWTSPLNSYENNAIYLDATASPAFNSTTVITKGKAVDEERAQTPSPAPSI